MRAVGAAGHEERRVRLLDRHRQHLVLALDRAAEMRALVGPAAAVEGLQHQRHRLLPPSRAGTRNPCPAPRTRRAGSPSRCRAGPARSRGCPRRRCSPPRESDRRAAGDDRGADPDARGARREIGHVGEAVRHDAVVRREVVLRDPGRVEAEALRLLDLGRGAGMHGAVRVWLLRRVGVGGEQHAEFHGDGLPRSWCGSESSRTGRRAGRRDAACRSARPLVYLSSRPRAHVQDPRRPGGGDPQRRGTPWPIRFLRRLVERGVSRRSFLKTIGVAGAAGAAPAFLRSPAAAQDIPVTPVRDPAVSGAGRCATPCTTRPRTSTCTSPARWRTSGRRARCTTPCSAAIPRTGRRSSPTSPASGTSRRTQEVHVPPAQGRQVPRRRRLHRRGREGDLRAHRRGRRRAS